MQPKVPVQIARSTRIYIFATMAGLVVAVATAAAPMGMALAAPDLQPRTTHAIQGRENCLMCHPVGGGVKPSPPSHSTYTNANCISCHPAGEAAVPPPPEPTMQPTMPPAAQPQPASASQPSPTRAPAASPSPTPVPVADEAPGSPSTQVMPAPSPSCTDCHSNPALSMALPGGEELNLFVDEAQSSGSVHQGRLGCGDCHTGITGFPHDRVQVSSGREYSVAQNESCKRCHFVNYTEMLDSIHYDVMASGNQNAPLCSDCHGYHNIFSPGQRRSEVSLSCAGCHRDVYETYAGSVHGAALVEDGNRDVPACIDCHGAHTIKSPATATFRLDSPEMCGSCHADEALMRKYGLSSRVLKTYVQDFHGTTVALARLEGSDNWTDKAVCSDCHGVHDIESVKDRDPAEMKQKLVVTCQKCHPDAGTNFPDAWLSHYELSLEKAPLPWLVRTWYIVLIPLMIAGLVLHIGTDLWRIARNR